jgi:hypothetical protein
LAHCFGIQSMVTWFHTLELNVTQWWQEHVKEKAVHLIADRKKRVRIELGTRYNLWKHAPSDQPYLTRP